jgi:fibronectin type 3 domain-containing protein
MQALAVFAALALPLMALFLTMVTSPAVAATAAEIRAKALAPYYGAMSAEAITVKATDAVYEDRVVIRWPAAPAANVFWRVKRGTDLLTVLSSQDSSYNDTSGIPGQVYSYSVTLYDANTQAQIDLGSDNGSRIIFAPTNVKASDGQFASKVVVTWSDQSAVESEYRVYRAGVLVATLPPNSDSYSDSTVAANGASSYCVRAANGIPMSAEACDNGSRGQFDPPTSVVASDGQYSGSVHITWKAPAGGAAGFRVFRNNFPIATLVDTATSYQDANAATHVIYEYCVTSLNGTGGESIKVCDVGSRTLAGPSNVTATDITFDDKVRITWTDAGETENGFKVFRQGPAEAANLVASVAANVTAFDDRDAVPGILYRYCVVAFSDQGGTSDSLCDMGTRSLILAPTAVVATDSTLEDRVDISWQSSATNAVLFKIYRDGVVIQTVGATTRSTSDFGVTSHTPHVYGVRAVTALEAQSAIATDNGSRALNAPAELKASDEGFESYVMVSWIDRSAFEGGYVIERKLPAAANFTIVDSVATGQRSYLDDTGVPGVIYTYRVRTFDALGTAPNGPTDAGSRTLAVPASLAASDGTFEDKIVLTWLDKSAAEIGYRIYRKTGAAPFTVLDSVPANTATYTNAAGIAFGTTYTYKVVAYDLKGESGPQTDDGNTAILAPGDVNASDTYADKVTLSWVDRSVIETGYVITRNGAALSTAPANATTYTDVTAALGTTYEYCVKAINASTQSGLVCDEGVIPVVASGVANLVVEPVTPAVNVDYHNAIAVHGDDAVYLTSTAGADTVHILVRANGVWSENQTFAVSVAHSGSVDLFADRLIVGLGGSAVIYTKNGTTWGNPVTITGGLEFGDVSVSIAGDRALVGEFDTGVPGTAGKVYVYRFASGSWTQEQVISAGIDRFALDVDLDETGSRAIISSQNAAHIYKRTGTSWALEQTIPVQSLSVSIDGTTVGLSGVGSASAYNLVNGTWVATGSFPLPPNPRRVAVDEPYLLASTGGAAMLFERRAAGWAQVMSVASSNGPASEMVDLGGGTGMVGTGSGPTQILLFDVIAPAGPLAASDGSFAGRVQLSWTDNSVNESGFRIYRDGVLIDSTETNAHSYSDYDGEPGRVYEYAVAPFVAGGSESSRSTDLGRRPPDGSLTGRVATRAGAGVAGVQVCLDPSPASGLLFDGVAGKAEVTGFEAGAAAFNQATAEFWVKTRSTTASTPFAYGANGGQFNVNIEANGKLTAEINGNGKTFASTSLVNDGQWHHVAIRWNDQADVIAIVDGVESILGESYGSGQTVPSGGTLTLGSFAGQLDEVRLWRVARSHADIVADHAKPIDPLTGGLMTVLSFDEGAGPASFDIAGVDEYARLSGGVFWSGDVAPVQACAVTDAEGDYAMRNIQYGSGSTFLVMPQLGPHQFEPAYKSISLSGGNPVQNEVAFTDISSFTLAGRVTLDSTTCAAPSVEVLVDGTPFGMTNEDGRYAVAVGFGTHTVTVRQGTRVFDPASRVLKVEGDAGNLDFFDKTPRMLTVDVGGGCNQPIGTVTFQVRTEDGCATLTRSTASDITLKFGPRKYQVQVLDVTGVPSGLTRSEILRFFQALGPQEVDLTSGNASVALIYRAPIVVEIEGFETPACPTLALPDGATVPAVPVLQQGEKVPLTIRVYEDYGGGNHCPLDSTTVTIVDEILDEQDSPARVVVANGEGSYTTIANMPNVFPGRVGSDGSDRSYQKPLTVVAQIPGQGTVTKTSWAVVIGHRPRAGTFTSTTSEIPLWILRDPPGDASTAFVEEGTKACNEFTDMGLQKVGSGVNHKLEAGLDFQKGTPFLLTNTKLKFETENKFRIGIQFTEESALQVCTETTERWSTPTDDSWIDGDGDVFMGGAINLLFAKTDKLELAGCGLQKSEAITVGSSGFSSTYVYTAKHINEVVIPQLEELSLLATDNRKTFYENEAENWRRQLRFNDSLKAAATPKENVSFSAGADIERTSTTDSTKSFNWTVQAYTNNELAAGFEFAESGNGGIAQWVAELAFEYEHGATVDTTRTTSIGYTLSDDDVYDFFSVDILEDAKYKTPVFKTVSGRSSCPEEASTQHRDGIEVRIEPPFQDAVAPDGVAHFVLSLTNVSEADEEREYYIQPVQTSNPDGAGIFLVGNTFQQLAVFLKPGQTHNWEMTVKRGPSKFRYEDIAVMAIPTCQFDYWRKTGLVQAADTAYFSVNFQAPCSDVTLFEPKPGWTYNRARSLASHDSLMLTLTDFRLAVSETDSIQSAGAEYRLADTETWVSIKDVSKTSLKEGKDLVIPWKLTSIPDGTYEVRAYTRCSAGFTYSTPATGRIDRKAPLAFGTPQPADSLLSLGDEISITFDEDIECDSLTLANVTLQINNPNGTVEPIKIETGCNGRTIVINPVDPAYPLLEGKKLRARVTGIMDRLGNPMIGEVAWRTDVRRNVFTWKEVRVNQRAPYRNPGSFTATLVNGTGAPTAFTLSGLPAWLSAIPASGTIAAGDSLPVQLVISPTQTTVDPVNVDKEYTATINANVVSPAISSPLAVKVVIYCAKADWVVDASDFQYSMNVVALEQISGVAQADPNDKVAAFVGNQLRGVASPIQVAGTGNWLTFLTVYSNRSTGENVRFQVFDDSDCRLYTGTNKTVRFEADKREGSTAAPVALNVQDIPAGIAQQQIVVNEGWTWVSFNLTSPTDMTLNGVFGDLNPSTGDLVKSQTLFSQFDLATGWAGSLGDVSPLESYAVKLTTGGTIVHEGTPVAAITTEIPVATGWNWIPYLPQVQLPINTALQLVSPQNGDVLKSQSQFAQYVKAGSVATWTGDLKMMNPGLGYRMFLSNASIMSGKFKYNVPSSGGGGIVPIVALSGGGAPARAGRAPARASAQSVDTPAQTEGTTIAAVDPTGYATLKSMGPGWQVDARSYPYNMTVTGALQSGGVPLDDDRYVVAAMVGGEIRGIAQPVHVDGVDRTLVFLMVYGREGETAPVTFRVYDTVREEVRDVAGSIAFAPDLVSGSVAQPFALSLGGSEPGGGGPAPVAFALSQNVPNPPKGQVVIRFAMPTAQHVVIKVHDIAGREVMQLVDGIREAGNHTVTLDTARLKSGLYFYQMKAGSFVQSRKMAVVN